MELYNRQGNRVLNNWLKYIINVGYTENVLPEKLYRFRPMRRYDEVTKSYLHLSCCTGFNDPFDSSFELIDDITREYNGSDFSRDYEDEYRKEIITKYRNKIFVTSFSEDFTSILQWSHYAENHRGFCIEYDVETLSRELPEDMHLCRVRYMEDFHEVSDDSITYEDLVTASLIKYKDWDYENEWRVVKIDEDGSIEIDKGINVEISSDCITKIIIGCEVERDQSDGKKDDCYEEYMSLWNYTDESDIDIEYYYTSRRKFELVFNRVTPPTD